MEIPLIQRTDNDLVELVLQLHCRSLHFPSEEMHKNSKNAREELESRLIKNNMAFNKLETKTLNAIKEKINEFETCKDTNFYGSIYDISKEFMGDHVDSGHAKFMDKIGLEYNSRKRKLDEAISWIDALTESNKETK